MIVVDAGVVVAALCDGADLGATARFRISAEDLRAPHLLDLEVLSVVTELLRRGEIGEATAARASTALATLPVARAPHGPLLRRCWELRHNLTPYDASYIALAESLGVPVVTTDARAARAPGIRCAVEVLA